MAVWSKALPLTACRRSLLSGFEFRSGHVRTLPLTWGSAAVFAGFLHYLRLSRHKFSTLSGTLPREFAWQPQSLSEYECWNATEFRQCLLYTGPLVLHKILQRNT